MQTSKRWQYIKKMMQAYETKAEKHHLCITIEVPYSRFHTYSVTHNYSFITFIVLANMCLCSHILGTFQTNNNSSKVKLCSWHTDKQTSTHTDKQKYANRRHAVRFRELIPFRIQ